MKMNVVYTHTARNDLRAIFEYVAHTLQVPKTAQALTERIMAEVRTLEKYPERCPLYKEEPWHSQGVRFLTVRNYLVFYTVKADAETVSVARIMYGGRDTREQLEETTEW